MSATPVLIGFGSNLGESESLFGSVLDSLEQHPQISHFMASPLIATSPVGGPSGQPTYRNACFAFHWNSSQTDSLGAAIELFGSLADLERQHGRTRRIRWGSRTLDLDLLLFGELFCETVKLTIPHPRMSFRRFVLEPANHIASDWVHVESGMSISKLKARIDCETPAIDVTGAWHDREELLKTLIERNLGCLWMFDGQVCESGNVGSYAGRQDKKLEPSLRVHLRRTMSEPRLKGTGAPTLQLVLDDCEDFIGEITAGIEAIRD